MRPVRRNPLRPILSAVALVGVFMALGWYSGDQAAAGVDVQMRKVLLMQAKDIARGIEPESVSASSGRGDPKEAIHKT